MYHTTPSIQDYFSLGCKGSPNGEAPKFETFLERKLLSKELASTWLSMSSFSTVLQICSFSTRERMKVCLS